MFFLKELSHKIQLHPECFGPELQTHLKDRLYRDVEGTCSGRFGYIITVLSLKQISHGSIIDGVGSAEFTIKYQAILFKPFKGEVLDAVVTTVNKMGFFAEVGPLNIFVSNHLIPSEFTFDPNVTAPCYVGEEGINQRIAKDELVRLRIIGTRIDATEIFAIGTLKEDYLGLIS